MEENFINRLKIYINHTGLSNNRFAEKAGFSGSQLSHMISSQKNFGYDKLIKILNSFPELNSEWLLRGEGSMLLPIKSPITNLKGNKSTQNIDSNSSEAYLIHKKILRKNKELQSFYDAWVLYDDNNSEIKVFINHYIDNIHDSVWNKLLLAIHNGEINDDFIDQIASELNKLTKYTNVLSEARDYSFHTLSSLKEYDIDKVLFYMDDFLNKLNSNKK